MSGPALLVAPVLAVEAVVLAWALRTGHIARIWEVLRGLLRAPHRRPLPAAQEARLGLKAPNPMPGQCPVCSLEDLDERAADDAFMGDTGTPLARVVAYGPDRAHSECAAVVPYVPPLRSTSGGTRRAHPGFWIDGEYVSCGCDLCEGAQACAAVPLAGGRRMCLAHNEGDPRCTVYPPAGSKPGKLRDQQLPEVLTRPGPGAHHHFGFYTPGPGAKWTYCGCEEMREPPAGPIA